MTFTLKKSAVALVAVALVASSFAPANAATKPTPKPSITSGAGAGGFDRGRNSSAFAKYTACLAKAGIKLPDFGGGRRGFGTPGTRPTGAPNFSTPRPRPTLSLTPTQQKAFAACAALRPSFGAFGGPGGDVRPDGRGGGINPGAITPGGRKIGGGTTAPKVGTSAAYFACLNAHGLPVTTPAQVAGLDSQNTKVIAALKACAGK